MTRWCTTLILCSLLACDAATPDHTPTEDPEPTPIVSEPECPTLSRAWWEFGLIDPVMDQIALHYLGQAWHQSADVAEVLETIGRVDSTDRESWTHQWRATAERLEAVATSSEESGHARSASHAYLRAATYYRAALHRHTDPTSAEVPALAQRQVDAFAQFLTLSESPCAPVEIPYEATTLPGYFCRADTDEPAPVLLFQEGRDAWAEDGKFVADEALSRGYHVLLFDGPGMSRVLRLQGLPFRHDWETVVTPVVDFALAQPGVDPERVGLMAVSMGGYLGARAAAFEPRLAVLIVNPGVVAWHEIMENFLDAVDPGLLPLVDTDPAAFDAAIEELSQQVDLIRWGMEDFMWRHGVDTPSELIVELRRYTVAGFEDQITAHTLVVDAEAEEWGQSPRLFDALTTDKDYLLFTSEEAAQFHVQPGATAIHAHRVFDWLDDTI
ncbi:MAG: alpha/beta fold hydrolase [Myxococcales bacterium]|nr:alpha/beta fold hydrolase [Myxococcales bacterium]